jgi:polyribonucleotide nucleotidyltransferase
LLHVSEIAEHRVKEVKDELREGDQILVKVLAIEGNRIKLSRKAVLREQRAKLGLPEPGQIGTDGPGRQSDAAPRATQPIDDADDDGDDFEDDGEESAEEPNFNRADAPPPVPVAAGGQGGNGPGGQRRPGGRRRRGGRRPGSGSGGPQGGGNR